MKNSPVIKWSFFSIKGKKLRKLRKKKHSPMWKRNPLLNHEFIVINYIFWGGAELNFSTHSSQAWLLPDPLNQEIT